MGKHLSRIEINLGERTYVRPGVTRVRYTLTQYGKVLKSGSGIGDDGAYAAACKALKRLEAKGVK